MSQPAPTDPPDTTRKLNWGRWVVFLAVVAAVALFLAYGPDEITIIGWSAAWRADARNHLFVALVLFFVAEVVLVGL